ncbi:enolase C-terminal domain-like protein [Halobium salinum]|uniref:glucarate dehydratase n=1 Tax=Halobium salinum TaxID=1364940 RepID=A0ABD5PI53_9EURY|nr:enolase C-terminal domain-like protein [Halobium salinum]
MPPTITSVEAFAFTYDREHVRSQTVGPLVYAEGETAELTGYAVRIDTDSGVTGEFVGGTASGHAQIAEVAPYLVGENPLDRERHWSELKRALRATDRMGLGPLDIALWDLAGERYDAPVHELLGTYRDRLPAYASTYFGDADAAGLDTPAAYADYAEACRDAGFPAFKVHPVEGGDVDRDVATVHAVADAVGDDLDLMLDPVCGYGTFAEALAVGRACDECGFYWYEDPYRDAGTSAHGHGALRDRLDTPLLQAEMIRGVEAHTDFVDAGATDFVRADPVWDGGITGAMKIARVAEGHGLDVEYHLAGPHTRHCMAATRNANYYELGLVGPEASVPHSEPPVYDSYTDGVDALDGDGTVPVPDGPGLGVDYDWAYIEDNATDVVVAE